MGREWDKFHPPGGWHKAKRIIPAPPPPPLLGWGEQQQQEHLAGHWGHWLKSLALTGFAVSSGAQHWVYYAMRVNSRSTNPPGNGRPPETSAFFPCTGSGQGPRRRARSSGESRRRWPARASRERERGAPAAAQEEPPRAEHWKQDPSSAICALPPRTGKLSHTLVNRRLRGSLGEV